MFRLLGNFPRQVAGCRCTLLAENFSISLAGSEEQINFSQQSPKMLKMASKKLFPCFVVVFRSFSQNFPLGAPENRSKNKPISKNALRRVQGSCSLKVMGS